MSISDVHLEESLPDKDEFTGDPGEVFSGSYHLAHSTLSLNKAWVLNVDTNCDSSKYLAAFSNRQVNVYGENLTTVANIRVPHEKAVTKCAFSKSDPNLLLTSSVDCTVKVWDLRAPEKATRVMEDTSDKSKHEGPPKQAGKPILDFDTSADSRLICAGTEKVGEDAFLLFWDLRAGSMMGGYWEAHDDDVTCVKFHPTKSDSLASGSTDGLVNIFDLSEPKEEDALVTCHNTEDSVSSLHWFTKKDESRYLAISTHTESLQLWDTDDYQPYQTFDRNDVAHGIRRCVPEHAYIVGMHDQEDQGFQVLAGSRFATQPCLRLANVKNKKLKPFADLKDEKIGGGGLVRCSAKIKSGFITGSEAGVVAVWKEGTRSKETPTAESLKFKSKSKTARDKPY